ncbi:helix-turn-helix domain-containing protein [Streptomyces sp. SID13726]|uniref:nSTAND1 domain-containing NTPase n=1 Tax=Streptomyces sp. SID13726 TaxID=2706058 RepID=UPI0013B73BA1|nr:helix-turn-helix domain-containing protein [Streptomyces sp. SID13726]
MTGQRGRPERPLDPDAGPVQRFAHELRCLRRTAGSPSYRVMADQSRVSVSALSRAAAGERLPSAAVVRAYARACGADPDEWEVRLKAAGEQVSQYGSTQENSPYLGPAPFDREDENLFFGRGQPVEDAVRLILDQRFAVLTGASGTGKSSLLRAGVVPRLKTLLRQAGGDVPVHVVTPGPTPAATHAGLLAARPDGPERLVAIDRFEEIFTVCRDRRERWRFVDLLLSAQDPTGRLRVLVAMDGTFRPRCAEHPALAETLRRTVVPIPSMSRQELRAAVVGPATASGLRVERTLTTRIVEDVVGQPGALPNLSCTLREIWRRRPSGVLTLAAYEELGGVHGMAAARAEELYRGLSPAQADTAQRILLAMIRPGEGRADACRPLPRTDLCEWSDPDVPEVLELLVRARVVTGDEDKVQLSHDALVTSWPRLRRWIEENRDRLRAHRHLAVDSLTWQAGGNDPGGLYRGARLAVADALFARHSQDHDLTCLERSFLSASRVACRMDRWRADRADQRLRKLVLALCLVTAGALVAGVLAWDQNGLADQARRQAQSRQAAALAGRMRLTDPRTAALLSVAAWRLAPLPESRDAVLGSLTDPELDTFTAPRRTSTAQDFLTGSGHTLLHMEGGHWSSWDVTTHRRTGSGRLPDAPVTAVGPDGQTFALRGRGSTPGALWQLPSGRRAVSGHVLGFGAGPDSYAVLDPDGRARLRAIDDDRVLFETTGADALVSSVDHRLVAVCSAGHPLSVWDTASGRELAGGWRTLPMPACSSAASTFDRSGTRLAVVTADGIGVWDTATGRRIADIDHPDGAHLDFTADGRFLALAGRNDVSLWRISTPDAPVFRHPLTDGPLTDLALDPGRPVLRYLASGTVHSLDISGPLSATWRDRPVGDQLLSPDGRVLATADQDGGQYHFRLVATTTGRTIAQLPTRTAVGPERRQTTAVASPDGGPLMSFSPDSRFFSYGTSGVSSRLAVWDVYNRRERASLDVDPRPPGSTIRSIALSPGGRKLLIARLTPGDAPTGEVWDTAHRTLTDQPDVVTATRGAALAAGFGGPATSLPFGQDIGVPLVRPHGPAVVALSADGTLAATDGELGAVTVWRGNRVRSPTAVLPAAPAGCAPCSQVTALAFSPDGRTLAAGYDSGAVRLLDVATRQPLGGSLSTPGDAIRSLAFGTDGGSVYAGSARVPLQRYVIEPRSVVTRLCERAGTTLTKSRWRTYFPETPYLRVCPVSKAGTDPAPPCADVCSPPLPSPTQPSSAPRANAEAGIRARVANANGSRSAAR